MSTTISHLYLDYNSQAQLYGMADSQNAATIARGHPSTAKTEAQINEALAPLGLKMTRGQMVSVDGFTVTPQNSAPVLSGESVTLPAITGNTAPAPVVCDMVNWMQDNEGVSASALMWLALSTLATSDMHAVEDAAKIKQAMQQSQLDAKSQEITQKQSEIDNERTSADNQLYWAIGTAIVSVACSVVGGGMLGDIGKAAGVVSALGNSVGALGNAAAQDADVHGAKGQMEQAQKEQIMWQKQQEMYQMNIDQAQDNYDQAKDHVKAAIKILSDHYENMTQAMQAVARG